jgi:hypothetical protein
MKERIYYSKDFGNVGCDEIIAGISKSEIYSFYTSHGPSGDVHLITRPESYPLGRLSNPWGVRLWNGNVPNVHTTRLSVVRTVPEDATKLDSIVVGEDLFKILGETPQSVRRMHNKSSGGDYVSASYQQLLRAELENPCIFKVQLSIHPIRGRTIIRQGSR